MRLFLFLILMLFAMWAVVSTIKTQGYEILKEVKERYALLRRNLPPGAEWKKLEKPIVITGFSRKYGEIGYNVNKGAEIGLCVDPGPDAVNKAVHVLIHELAHAVSENYSHDKKFWDNFDTLKEHCVSLGIYKPIPTMEKYCGKYVRD